jgi:hypothetical protein
VARFFVSLTFAGAVLSGCATTPSDSYSTLLAAPSAVSIDAVLRSQRTAPDLRMGVDHQLTISQQDPVAEHAGVRGSFQTLQIRPTKSGPVTVQVESICDCLGLEKYVLLPKLFIASTGGAFIETRLLSQAALDPTMGKRARVLSVWTADLPAAGTYTLLIMADNARVGQTTASMSSTSSIYGGVPGVVIPVASTYQLKVYPFGSLVVKVDSAP